MAILKREEFFTKLNERIGNNTDDESLAFIEDMTDTYDDLERRANGDGTDWEKKYRENDEAWRKKYTRRFFHGGSNYRPDFEEEFGDDEEDKSKITIDDLFKEKE